MTPATITISGEGSELIERLRAGMESRELIDLFGLKFAGVKLEIYTHGDPHAVMLADEVTEAQPAPWSGEGLPPVGTSVLLDDARFPVFDDYQEMIGVPVVVTAAFKSPTGVDMIACALPVGLCGCFRADMARPGKTPANIAAEEREAAVRELAGDIMGHAIGCRLPMSESGAERLADHLMMDGYTKTKREDQ